MRSLDEILADSARAQYEEKLEELLNVSTWTESNRDTQLMEAFSVIKDISTLSAEVVKQSLETVVDGESVITLTVRKELLFGLITFLQTVRANVDLMSDEEAAACPYPYEWLNDKIRLLVEAVNELERDTTNAMAVSPVEDL